MLRGDMTATAAGIRLLPPPGWVVVGAAAGAGKPLQQMDRVQYRMLPWADPQALHEMMHQGVSRCDVNTFIGLSGRHQASCTGALEHVQASF